MVTETTPMLTLMPSPWFAVCCLALLSSCTHTKTAADLEKIYRADEDRARAEASAVIFVPGFAGSELHDPKDNTTVWGAFLGKAHHPAQDPKIMQKFALPFASPRRPVNQLHDGVRAGSKLMFIKLNLPGVDISVRGYPGVFHGILTHLARGDRHSEGAAISPEEERAGEDAVIGFGYDWRRDLTTQAARLHEVVVAAAKARKARGLPARVDIVAHSLGTQVVRYWLRYGAAPMPSEGELPKLTWAGARWARRVLLVAPPNMGSVDALSALVSGQKIAAMLPRYSAALLATMPSLYQLMPRASHAPVVLRGSGETVDIYNVETWERYGWGPFNPDQDSALQQLLPTQTTRAQRLSTLRHHVAACLVHARRTHRAMDLPAKLPPYVRMHVFISDSEKVPSVLSVDPKTGEFSVQRHAAGDGRVSRRSALARGYHHHAGVTTRAPVAFSSVHFYDGDHFMLVANRRFLDDALYLLLEAPSPPAPPKR